MPVSVVCETTASVNAALRESLGSTGGVSCSQAANAKANAASAAAADDNKTNGSSSSAADDVDSLHGKLVASAKRVLLSKIDYEEVSNYGQTVLDSLKSKYIVLKPSVNNSMENGRNSPATCNNNNNNGANSDSAADANGNSSSGANTNGGGGGGAGLKKPSNPNELPAPKRVLYPRENVRIGWKSTGRKWDVGVGMMNVGNTCYLNSTLQALFHVPSMANWLMSDTAHMERCESTDSGCIVCAMAKTLQASQNSQSAIRPYFVYSKLKSICKHLVMGRQEDAHEFLRYLVEAMEKSYLSRFRNFKDLDQYSKETTPMNQILGGYLKSSVKCLSCNHVSVTFQHFQDLLLDIRKADTVDEALEGYFSRERLEDMGYKCEACKKKVSATKQFSLERAPIALCIQLKRFSMSGTKINKQITIKPRLDLTKFAVRKIPGEQLTYRLVAMVTHLGASQHCGHYTAIGLTESGTYYNYDDSYVRPISIQNVCNTNAYIIFYEMDTQPPRQVTSTQVSGAQVTTAVSSTSPKLNGHAVGSSPQRIIGPQLPPSFGNTTTNGSKLILNRNNTIPTTTSTSSSSSNSSSASPLSSASKISSKIMIHFKNNNNNATSTTVTTAAAAAAANSSNVKMSAATSSVTSATATSSTTSNGSTKSAFDNLKNGNGNDEGINNNNTSSSSSSNGLHTVGTGKFQDTGMVAKCSLGKRQNNITKNNNESSSSDDDDNENEIVSSSTTTTTTSSNNNNNNNGNSQAKTLPSMPKLGVDSINNNNNNNNNTFSGSSMKSPLSNGFATKKSPAPIKSLVPYGSETEEEETDANTTNTTTTTATTATSTGNDQEKRIVSNPLKRRQSSSSWSSASTSDNEGDIDQDQKPTTGIKIKKAATSTISGSSCKTLNVIKNISDSTTKHCNGISKKSSETIDNIFNSIKRPATTANTTTSSTTTSTTNGCVSSSPQKKKQLPNTNQQFTVTSTTPAIPADTFSSSSSSDSEDNTKVNRPQFKRSHSTPPSPPVVKTNSGIWQVTSLHPISACVSPTAEKAVVVPKNLKNPFASKPVVLTANGGENNNNKRLKKENRTFVGNGYQSGSNGGAGGAASDSTVSELLKHSHRGYGAPILTWNGQQSEIFRENYNLFDEKRIEDDSNENNNNNTTTTRTTTTTTTITTNNNGIDIIDFINIENPDDNFILDIDKSPRHHPAPTAFLKSQDEFLLQQEHDDDDNDDDEIQQRLYNNDIDLEITTAQIEPLTADTFKNNDDDDDDDFNIDDEDYAIIHSRESPSSSSNALLYDNNNKHPINYPICRQDLHLDLNILNSDTINYSNNNNCLPPIGTTILTLSSANTPSTSCNISTKHIGDEQSHLKNICYTSVDNQCDNDHIMLNIDNCSPKTNANATPNTYCLSPNSTDNEPTTPTLATTINDIIFQFSDDSLDNL